MTNEYSYFMKKWISFLIFFIPVLIHSQVDSASSKTSITELQAKGAVFMIVSHSGLLPNFVVRENQEVKTAIAYIKNKQRYIEYNPEIISGIIDSSKTDWSAVSILAHEIAHHLLGHTLNPKHLSPGDELACDRYSGFILQSMGASKEQSQQALMVAASVYGSKSHPPRDARIEAISQGWDAAAQIVPEETLIFFEDKETYLYKLRFEGDENLYYISKDNKVVWYNNYARPIIFGKFQDAQSKSYEFEIVWEDEKFFIDNKGKVWNLTSYNVMLKVGRIESMKQEHKATKTKTKNEK